MILGSKGQSSRVTGSQSATRRSSGQHELCSLLVSLKLVVISVCLCVFLSSCLSFSLCSFYLRGELTYIIFNAESLVNAAVRDVTATDTTFYCWHALFLLFFFIHFAVIFFIFICLFILLLFVLSNILDLI